MFEKFFIQDFKKVLQFFNFSIFYFCIWPKLATHNM